MALSLGSPVQGELSAARLTEGLTAGAKGFARPRLGVPDNPSERHPPPTSPCTGEARSTKFSGTVSDGNTKKRGLRTFSPLLFFHKSPRIIHIARCFYFFPELFHSCGKRWKTAKFPVNPGPAFPQGTVDGVSGGLRHPRRIFPKTFHLISSFSPVFGQTPSNNRRV